MKLIHFSDREKITLSKFSVHQSYYGGSKPAGFWFSVEDQHGWRQWCQNEYFHLDCLAYSYPVTITTSAKILHIDTPANLGRFHTQFNKTLYGTEWINWGKVAEEYQGIIISPYSWSHRHNPNMTWYYGWDCASGCVWEPEAIKIPEKGEKQS